MPHSNHERMLDRKTVKPKKDLLVRMFWFGAYIKEHCIDKYAF